MALGREDRSLGSLWRASEPEPVSEWPALELHDVFKIYRSGPVETVALRGLEMRIERGALSAVLGPSGCGKSTMLALAAALDQPSAGEVRAAGRSLQQMDENERTGYRAQGVAVVFQSENLWSGLSAGENVALSLQLAGRDDSVKRAKEALANFGLSGRYATQAGALSGGEQQRVAIAAAYARAAPLVLADEPTGELDARNERLVLEAFAQLREQARSTVVLVTHSERVAREADQVLEMRDGRISP